MRYPYLNSKGFLIRRRDIERASSELLTKFKFVRDDLGLEIADVLASILDKATDYADMVKVAAKVFNYRMRNNWYFDKDNSTYIELGQIVLANGPTEDDFINNSYIKDLKLGLTDLPKDVILSKDLTQALKET
jgi:hypothetical protein